MTKSFGINLEKITKPIISDRYVTTPTNSSNVNSIFGENSSVMQNVDFVETANVTETKTNNASKAEYKEMRNKLNEMVNNYFVINQYEDKDKNIVATKKTLAGLIDYLKKLDFGGYKDLANEFITELEKTHNTLYNKTYNNDKEIKSAIKTASKEGSRIVKDWIKGLLTGEEYSGFGRYTGKKYNNFKKIAGIYQKALRNETIQKQYETLLDKFTKQENETNEKDTFEKKYELFETFVKQEKSPYEKEILKKHKEALQKVADSTVRAEILKNTESTKKSSIKANIENKDDKFVKKAIKNNKENIKLTTHENKILSAVNNAKSLSTEEIKKEFGNDMAITLAGSKFETNGQIDMKKLGEEILKTIGADTTVNYSKNGTPANEVHQVKCALEALGVKEISFDQVKKLCKYYDIPVEGKYDCSLKNIGKALLKSAPLAILTGSEVLSSFKVHRYSSPGVEAPFDFTIDINDLYTRGAIDLETYQQFLNSGSEINIRYHGTTIVEPLVFERRHIHLSTIALLAAGTALTTLLSLRRPEEVEEFVKPLLTAECQPTETFINELNKKYGKNAPEFVKFAEALAIACSYEGEDGKLQLDATEMRATLVSMQGGDSKLNANELKRGFDLLKAPDRAKAMNIHVPEPNKEHCDCKEIEQPAIEENKTEETKVGTIEVTPTYCETKYQGKNYSYTCWDNLLDAYGNCLLEKCGNNRALAIRVLKIAQGVKDTAKFNNIDELITLAKKSYTRAGRQEMKNNEELKEWFDYDKFYRYFSTSDMTDIILPDFDDCIAGEVKKGARFKSSGSTNLKGTNPTITRKSTGYEATATYNGKTYSATGDTMEDAINRAKDQVKDTNAKFSEPTVKTNAKKIDC